MQLREYAADYMAHRSTILLDEEAVTKCIIEATREYQAWGKLNVDEVDPYIPAFVNELTSITPSEWGVIKPLAELMCERESALIQEASRVMSHESYGRTSGEIEQDIINFRNEQFRRWAFYTEVTTI